MKTAITISLIALSISIIGISGCNLMPNKVNFLNPIEYDVDGIDQCDAIRSRYILVFNEMMEERNDLRVSNKVKVLERIDVLMQNASCSYDKIAAIFHYQDKGMPLNIEKYNSIDRGISE